MERFSENPIDQLGGKVCNRFYQKSKRNSLDKDLSIVTDRIRREIWVDDSLANELVVKNGFLTGEVKVTVSFRNKDEVLHPILKRFGVTPDECAAVGDDETMIPLFEKVGLGIAFNPRKKVVEKHADVIVKGSDLRQVLPHLLL